ncbi:hypothetical protein DVH24_016331 [Malus domestica]|uniref:RNase H type-1 domain-containing protein n=1 Tax=Malus domestica TaxID=3750 RepID=A0A498HRW1_MALDO|nr:hypothetical protein DVH24_016331 [Malus domestica]
MCVEGDSKLVIDAVKVSCTIPWQLRNIIEDIKWLVSSFDSNFLSHVYRVPLPPMANKAYFFGCIGTGYNRGYFI